MSQMSANCGTLPRHLLILYGSQTGVSQSVAERIVMQTRGLFRIPVLSTSLHPMDFYTPISRLVKDQSVILFVCSTTGYGVPPDNMCQFWKRIMHRSLPIGRALTSNHRFLVLGLGDSSYPKFNVVAKKLYRRMIQLGANPLPLVRDPSSDAVDPGLGLADEQAEFGIQSLLLWWLPCMWNLLSEHLGLSFHADVPTPLNYQFLESAQFIADTWPKYTVSVDEPTCSDPDVLTSLLEKNVTLDRNDDCVLLPSTKKFRVLNNKRLTSSDHFQDTRLLSLSIEINETLPDFKPGDVIYACPRNHREDVCELFNLTGIDPNQQLTVCSRDSNFPLLLPSSSYSNPYPVRSTLLCLASYYFDLNSIPNPFFFSNLAAVAYRALEYAPSEYKERLQLEFDRLTELSSFSDPDMVEELFDYVYRPRRTVLEVLIDFPTTSEFLNDPQLWFDVLPGPIRPRPYSIASAPPDLQILLAVVSFSTRMSTPRRGLTSSYLSSLGPNDCFQGWIRSNVTGGFNFAPLLKPPAIIPCVLIATGTGIAPFRSFLWYQHHLFPNLRCPNLLFFGCRYSTKDFYFALEWDTLKQSDHMELCTAFSRQTASRRVYVQDRLIENAEKLCAILKDPSSFVLVCGNAKAMPKQVSQALQSVLETAGHLSAAESERWLTEMEESGRLQIEAWS